METPWFACVLLLPCVFSQMCLPHSLVLLAHSTTRVSDATNRRCYNHPLPKRRFRPLTQVSLLHFWISLRVISLLSLCTVNVLFSPLSLPRPPLLRLNPQCDKEIEQVQSQLENYKDPPLSLSRLSLKQQKFKTFREMANVSVRRLLLEYMLNICMNTMLEWTISMYSAHNHSVILENKVSLCRIWRFLMCIPLRSTSVSWPQCGSPWIL